MAIQYSHFANCGHAVGNSFWIRRDIGPVVSDARKQSWCRRPSRNSMMPIQRTRDNSPPDSACRFRTRRVPTLVESVRTHAQEEGSITAQFIVHDVAHADPCGTARTLVQTVSIFASKSHGLSGLRKMNQRRQWCAILGMTAQELNTPISNIHKAEVSGTRITTAHASSWP